MPYTVGPDDFIWVGSGLVKSGTVVNDDGTVASSSKKAADDEFDGSAAASIKNVLTQYGLEELVPLVDGWVRQGLSWPEIEVMLRDPSTEPGKVFDRYFPEVQLRRKAGLAPMSVAEIQDYRTRAKQLFRAAGLPEGFYDANDDFQRFITGDVSLNELQARVQDGFVAASQAPAEVRAELERMFGAGSSGGALAAYFLDPSKALPVLERQLASAKIGGSSIRTGYGQLAISEADRLAGLGVSDAQAAEGFGYLAGAGELVNPLVGTGEDAISRKEQLGAVFESNANAARRIQQRARSRTAAFESGGSFASTREGFTGVGSAA